MTPHWNTPSTFPFSKCPPANTNAEVRRIHCVTFMTRDGFRYSCSVPVESQWSRVFRRVFAGARRLRGSPAASNTRRTHAVPPEGVDKPDEQAFLRNYRNDPALIMAAGLIVGAVLFLSHDIWHGFERINLQGGRPGVDAPAHALLPGTVVMDDRVGDSLPARPRVFRR